MPKTNKIAIQGTIDSWGENSAAQFTQRFNEAAAGADSIDLHLHCYGGIVFEGNLIYNLIRKSKVPVDIYVDGVAASMGSIIMLAGRNVYMSENAFVMIHAPYGYTIGTADEMTKSAKLLKAMEANFIKAYKARTGKPEEEIKQWLVGDNWFSAQEALDAKLIDGIVDAIDVSVEDISTETVKDTRPADLYSMFKGLVSPPYEAKHDNNHSSNQSKQTEMDKKSIISRFGLTGVTEQSSDAEIEASLEAKMNAETQARKTAEASLANNRKNAITAAIEAKGSLLTDAQRKAFEALGEASGLEVLQEALAAVKQEKTATIASMIAGGNGSGAATGNRAEWDFDRWQKEDPRGMEKLGYEEMNALYKAKFGTDAPR